LKTLIIYFSQTGGTKKIAEAIRTGIKSVGAECDLIKIKNVDPSGLRKYDLIGFGTPTFFYREPLNVQRFINNLPEMQNMHAFIFATHGSCLGNTFYYLSEELKEKGFVVIGAFDSYSDSSLQFYPKPMHTYGHPDEIELKEAEEFGKKICRISEKIRQGNLNLIPNFKLIEDTWWAKDSKLLTPKTLRMISPKFQINMEKCTQCMLCQTECPGDAVDISTNPPEIQKEGCIFCWFCEKVCPTGAIEADWSIIRANTKSNLRKYIKLLEEAEKQGKFRPYVDYRKIR